MMGLKLIEFQTKPRNPVPILYRGLSDWNGMPLWVPLKGSIRATTRV